MRFSAFSFVITGDKNMAQRGILNRFSDMMIGRKERPNQVVYFIRLSTFSREVDLVLVKCIDKARSKGALIDGRLPAPDVNQISYYQETMGDEFEFKPSFIESKLFRWMPGLQEDVKKSLSSSIFRMLSELYQSGKNVNVIKNVFIKYMCWIYYRFSQALHQIKADVAPIVVYDGEIGLYELQLLSILCYAGCDIILMQVSGEESYLKVDSESRYSQKYMSSESHPFPSHYSLKFILKQLLIPKPPVQALPSVQSASQAIAHHPSIPSVSQVNTAVPAPQKVLKPGIHSRFPVEQPTPSSASISLDFRPEPRCKIVTNSWCGTSPDPFKNILTPFPLRSGNPNELCNAFYLIQGVEDINTYENDLFQFYQKMTEARRRFIIVESSLSAPTTDEINRVQRGNYRFLEDMVRSLSVNLSAGSNAELQKYIVRAFARVILEEAKRPGMNLNKITNAAVYLISWFQHYQRILFQEWSAPATACFIFFGSCKKEKEILFLRMLSLLPVDVLIINPNINDPVRIDDSRVQVINHINTISLEHYPKAAKWVRLSTEGYLAERELDDLSADVGAFRMHQFVKANSIPLQVSTYEIEEFWALEIRERPNFEIERDVVCMPTLFSKLSGVNQPDEESYWLDVKQKFMTPETFVYKALPHVINNKVSSIVYNAPMFLRNGKLVRDTIKSHPLYPYRLIRPEIQEYMLDKIQEMLDAKLIRGTGTNGAEHAVIAASLSLEKEIWRLIQQFDFTRKNPKVLVINTGESTGSIYDAVQLAFLNKIGFDILFIVPTGYQCVEQWYDCSLVDDHPIGAYQYNYHVPNFEKLEKQSKHGLFGLFKRA